MKEKKTTATPNKSSWAILLSAFGTREGRFFIQCQLHLLLCTVNYFPQWARPQIMAVSDLAFLYFISMAWIMMFLVKACNLYYKRALSELLPTCTSSHAWITEWTIIIQATNFLCPPTSCVNTACRIFVHVLILLSSNAPNAFFCKCYSSKLQLFNNLIKSIF